MVQPRGNAVSANERYDQQRGTTAERGYGWRWQKRRAFFLRMYPLCGMRPNEQPSVMSACADRGVFTVATVVDHVIAHKGNDRLMWDEQGNWQSLCASCHGTKSALGL